MDEFLQASAMIRAAREKWALRGQARPAFAQEPGPGEESVWDYPRPPRIVADPRPVEVRFGERVLASTSRAVRVLETASPPTFYIPPDDVDLATLAESGRTSICEWKGQAVDFDLVGGPESVAWCYPRVFPEFASIAGWIAFYPARVECLVAGERVRPQPGGYYGGWITDEIKGPVKGEPGISG
ncbi:MAG: DUF427 domain-containing protein [Myxococcota bacterium]